MINTPSFWYLISFIIFIGLLYIPVRKRLFPMMQQEKEKIQNDLLESEQVLKKAKELLSLAEHNYQDSLLKSEHILEQANMEADKIKDKSKKTMNSITIRGEQQLKSKLQKIEQDITNEIKSELLNEVRSKAIKNLTTTINSHTDDEIINAGLERIK